MYRKNCSQILMPDDFFLPFGGKLNKNNRWVKLAAMIPWWEFEDRYAACFKSIGKGEKALTVRVALGALLIQTKLGMSDREIVNQIVENPYLQYFLGYERYDDSKPPFDASLMVHFRKRLTKDILIEINELIAKQAAAETMPEKEDKGDDSDKGSGDSGSGCSSTDEKDTTAEKDNCGFLLLDATCAPSDIRYPTDLRLLNEAREKLEEIIDVLHEPDAGKEEKPRNYREKARKQYLSVEKQRKQHKKSIRKAIKQQLGYLKRDLAIIQRYLENTDRYELLSTRQREQYETIKKLYDQQLYMYKNRTHSVADRIVSISQPHIRPIVRGKANAEVEFGSKVMTSVVNGYCFVEKMSFDNFNEGIDLKEAVESYKQRFGHYPEAVLADTIFRNRENRNWLKEKGIRLSGPALGRPSKDKTAEAAKKQLEKKDAGNRNRIEGSYGVAKRKLGLALIKAKLAETTESSIVLQFLVMNLERRLRILLRIFYDMLFSWYKMFNWSLADA
jgi:IS5 family transposase